MQHLPQIESAWNDSLKIYQYDSCFKYVRKFISSADIAIANLEVTLAGKPYTGYPQFSAPDELAAALIYAGVDIVGTANNHSCDRGKNGIERTIRVLDSMGLKHTGTFTDSLSRRRLYPMIIRKNGFKLALLNYTYGTNGIEVPKPNIVNLIDTALIKKDLNSAKDSLTDKIIIFIHWGDEYKRYPNQYQTGIAEFCFRNGADIIIGMHPHVVQCIEKKLFPDSNGREVFIAYSLGNYISNQRDRFKDGGIIVSLDLVKRNGKVSIENAGYSLSWVYLTYENNRKKYYIIPVSEFEKDSAKFDQVSYANMLRFAEDTRELMSRENKGVTEKYLNPVSRVWGTD